MCNVFPLIITLFPQMSFIMNVVNTLSFFFKLLQVKPLKELTFNSHDIEATMTSRQFQVMLDVLTNLLFARLPK